MTSRQEVLNVLLAELLQERGLIAAPEDRRKNSLTVDGNILYTRIF